MNQLTEVIEFNRQGGIVAYYMTIFLLIFLVIYYLYNIGKNKSISYKSNLIITMSLVFTLGILSYISSSIDYDIVGKDNTFYKIVNINYAESNAYDAPLSQKIVVSYIDEYNTLKYDEVTNKKVVLNDSNSSQYVIEYLKVKLTILGYSNFIKAVGNKYILLKDSLKQ